MVYQVQQALPAGFPAAGFPQRDNPPVIAVNSPLSIVTTPSLVTISIGQLALVLNTTQTSSFNASSNNIYPVNKGSASITATLPAAPAVGDVIVFIVFGAGGNTFTLGLNSLNWYGLTNNPVSALEGIEFIQYSGATRGWVDL